MLTWIYVLKSKSSWFNRYQYQRLAKLRTQCLEEVKHAERHSWHHAHCLISHVRSSSDVHPAVRNSACSLPDTTDQIMIIMFFYNFTTWSIFVTASGPDKNIWHLSLHFVTGNPVIYLVYSITGKLVWAYRRVQTLWPSSLSLCPRLLQQKKNGNSLVYYHCCCAVRLLSDEWLFF